MGQSTPNHCEHFKQETSDGDLYTSFYVRMEFIRRWICEAARLAFSVAHFSSVEGALYYLEQDFRPRQNKAIIATISAFLQQIGPLRSVRAISEECASLAIRWLELFDIVFSRKTANTCGCKIGGLTPDVDFNTLLSDLNEYYKLFLTPVTDCPVNRFLQLDKKNGRSVPLLNDASAKSLPVVETLVKYSDEGAWIACEQCARIGDAVIALEQPGSWTLVHVDKAFDNLCTTLKRNHKKINAARAFDKDLYRKLNPKSE